MGGLGEFDLEPAGGFGICMKVLLVFGYGRETQQIGVDRRSVKKRTLD